MMPVMSPQTSNQSSEKTKADEAAIMQNSGVSSERDEPQNRQKSNPQIRESPVVRKSLVTMSEPPDLSTPEYLSVSDVLRSADLPKPLRDGGNDAMDRLWASSAEVDHQLESFRNKSSVDILITGSSVQDEILKKGTSYRSFLNKNKSARATMA